MSLSTEHLQSVQDDIEEAVTKRDTQNIVNHNENVTLLAVSKAQTAEKLRKAYEAGQTKFGENYLQEALNKQAELTDLNIEWHFIGPIQSNKRE